MKGRDSIWLVVMALCLVFMVGPLALVVLFSFGSNTLIGFPMGGLTLDWYGKLTADEGFRDAARISLIVATSVSILSTITGTLAAFALGRTPPKWQCPILAVISVPVLLPP